MSFENLDHGSSTRIAVMSSSSGYIDLVGATADRLDVIDLKTDAPPDGPIEAVYPDYAAQVRIYGQLLETTGVVGPRRLRCGVLLTADGTIRWLRR